MSLRRALLNELVALGFHYSSIRTFIQHERATMVNGSSALPHSSLGGKSSVITGGLSGGLPASDVPSAAGVMGQAPNVTLIPPSDQPQGSIYRQALAAGLSGVDMLAASIG
jgi:hypothetical protein